MKVLLVYANGVSEGYPPLGLAVISSVLKKADHKVALFDTSFYDSGRVTDRAAREKYLEFKKIKGELFKKDKGLPDVDFMNMVKKFKPDLIGVSSTTSEFDYILPFLRKIKKEYDIPLIVGGVHATVCPEKTIKEGCVDMLCIGEGEGAIVELCNKLQNNDDITKLRNIWVKKGGKIYRNPVRPLVQDLDSLPFPDWELFDDRHFVRPYQGSVKKYGYFAIGRGCPYSCTYCINKHLRDLNSDSKIYYRQKSVEYVISEMKAFKKIKGIDHVQFVDECFLAMPIGKLKKLADYFKKNIKASFYVQTRPETLSQEKIDILKQMGPFGMGMGVESGNNRIRNVICNRKLSKKQLINAFDLARKNNIRATSFNILGFPEERRKDVFETIRLNRRLKPAVIAIRFLEPFDGTVIKQMCKDRGYKILPPEERGMYYEDPVVIMPQLSKTELKGLRKTFLLYVKFPKIMWPLIKICEYDNCLSNLLYRVLGKIYWKVSG